MPKPVQYGFLSLADVMKSQVTPALVPRINAAILATLAEYNKQLNAMLALFSMTTNNFKVRYQTPIAKRLQPLDENGRARPTKGVGSYDVAFPMFAGGDAWGINFVAQQKMTVQDINDWLYSTLTADKAFIAEKLMIALLAKDPWVYTDEGHGELTIMPLANGDSQEYHIRAGYAGGTSDNHLLGQLEEISDANNPFPMIRRELIEHPENGGAAAEVIVLVPTAQTESIQNLAGFSEPRDMDVTPGIAQSYLSGTLQAQVPGRVIGKVNRCWIAEWPTLPDAPLIAVPYGAGGDPALAQRQHAEASLQGFFELPLRSDTPYQERQFQRHTGFGCQNRVGALVMTIGSAEYEVPAGYESPVN